jgi:hypothetical protein
VKGFDMRGAAGNCALIIDGQRHDGYSFALELTDDASPQKLGFLSGASEALSQAQRANQVQIEHETGELLDIRVLQVSAIGGLALIALKALP